jgi:hypothetical protein
MTVTVLRKKCHYQEVLFKIAVIRVYNFELFVTINQRS